LISESQEIAPGREADPEIRAEFGFVENRSLQEYVSGIGQRLARVSHRPQLRWQFAVVDSPVLNAFALPGGYIYFTREILAYINNEAELTAVMGHEIGHVTARHAVDQMTKAELANLGLGLGSILSPTLRQLGGLAQIGLGLLFLKYGRDDERDADQLGIEYSAKAGFDPREASGFFEVLRQAEQGERATIPTWLASHPDPPERVQATKAGAQKWIAQLGPKAWTVGRDNYLARIDGLAFGENPREGFLEGDLFFHPEMRFQIGFPEGWRVQNTKRSAIAAEPNRTAQVKLSIVAVPPGTSGESYAAQLAQKGLEPVEGRQVQIHGNRAYIATYRLQNQTLNALAAFISYRDFLFQILGVSGASLFPRHMKSFQNTIWSFRALNDPRILSVQPDRVTVRRTQGGQTLRELITRLPSSRVKPETIALLNRFSLDQPLPEGTMVKLIESGRSS
jgi:predicted Zn-dependent protease